MDQSKEELALTQKVWSADHQEFCHRALKRMAARVQLDISRYLPQVHFIVRDGFYPMCLGINVFFGDQDEIINGIALGEETGHVLRNIANIIREKSKFILYRIIENERRTKRIIQEVNDSTLRRKREVNESQVSEFFGFLGRRILYETTTETEKGLLFPDGKPICENLRDSVALREEARESELSRISRIGHIRGYRLRIR